MAGKLRRKDDQEREDILLIRAMRDSNVPKFLEQDLPLFRGIIKDLFPSVDVPFVDYGKLQKQIEKELGNRKLQPRQEFIVKIIQLLETMTVRHGNMLVGTTGTGKTTVSKILGAALGGLCAAGEIDPWYKPVKIDTCNPKAVTMGELFGEVSKLTNEWTEGIIPFLVKNAVANLETKDAEQKRWIVFDGPVDALWIENMNTVLDDNKMLCLNNGQRIKMPETCTMMFEVNDLKVASPATVSRCGMVYMEPEHLGWKVLVKTWHQKMEDVIAQPYLDKVAEALTPILEKLLRQINQNFKQVIQSQDSNLVASCLSLISIFCNKDRLKLTDEERYPNPEKTVFIYVAFSIIWSIGANLHDKDRAVFGEHLRGQIKQYIPDFPDGDVYEQGLNE
jgi:dynein heavy chain